MGESGKHTIVGLACNQELIALFALNDPLRAETQESIDALSKRGISSKILSGDSMETVLAIGHQLAIPLEDCRGGVSPEEKARIVASRGETAAFVGDGANDGLALSQAGVGIGISGGAEICMALSDIFLLRPNLELIVEAIDQAKKTLHQIHQQLAISLVYNGVAATLAVAGHIGPLAAAVVMPMSSLTVIASAIWFAPFRGENR